MHVVLRRQGVSLRAVWDGEAKPSSKQLHHWFRTAPDAPVTNPEFRRADDLLLLQPEVLVKQAVGTTVPASHYITLKTGAWGEQITASQFDSYGATRFRRDGDPLVIANLFKAASTDVLAMEIRQPSSAMLNFTHKAFTAQSGVAGGRLSSAAVLFGHAVAPVAADDVVLAEVQRRTSLRFDYTAASPSADLQGQVAASERVIMIRAPLPDVALLDTAEEGANGALAETPVGLMDAPLSVAGNPRGDARIWEPVPTHFVVGSQTPAHSPNTVRSTTPSALITNTQASRVLVYGTHTYTQ